MYKAVIVDDEPFVIEGMKDALDWSGFNFELCCCTTNPLLALEYLKNHPADLLITDISMPQMDGIELIRQVKSVNSLISILVLSAYDSFEYVRTAMRQGAENYLLKPLDPDELAESISGIVHHIKERATLSSTYGPSVLTFRSSFVESWVNGTLSEDEFITRSHMLGINLQQDNFTVLIFSAKEEFSQKMSQLFDFLLSVFIGTYLTHFYFETPTRLVCILNCIDGHPDIEQLLSTLNPARSMLEFPFFISVGNIVNNYEDVSESYKLAKKYLFLQYTTMHSIICENYQLSPSLSIKIEQDYSTIEESDYLCIIDTIFTPSIPKDLRMAYVFSIVGFGIAQTSVELSPDLSILRILNPILYILDDFDNTKRFLHEFVHTCYKILNNHQKTQADTYPCVDAVIHAVHEFQDKDICLKTLAAKLNMSPSYLGSIFHQQTGYYFNDYLNEERLKYAANLIENTDMKLKDIVDKAGLSSQTYFNRIFKRKYGTQPNAYRRSLKLKQL